MILRHVATRSCQSLLGHSTPVSTSLAGWRHLPCPRLRPWHRGLQSQADHADHKVTAPIDIDQLESRDQATGSSTLTKLFAARDDAVAPADAISEEYHAFQRHKKATQHLGSSIEPYYQPHTLVLNPPSPSDITLELLLASQSHLGHATSLWNPANARYIYGIRQGIHIISLDVTALHLRRACAIVRAVAERAGLILFVGTREGQGRAVVKAAELARGCHLFTRWVPGTITNSQQILGECRTLTVDENDQPIEGFESQLADQQPLRPDLVVCLNPLENYVLLHECGMCNIPTIGIIDTDADPTWVTYPIPANDDSLRCIQVIAGVLGRAGQEGQEERLAAAKQGRITYTKSHRLREPDKADVKARASDSGESASQRDKEVIKQLQSTDRTVQDPRLDALIALKRQQMGEPLTDKDRSVLESLEARGIRHIDQFAT